MATQTVSHVVSQSKSATFSIPKQIPQQITQTELVLLLSLRGRLHQLESQVEAAESSITNRLEAGCHVEEGDHSAAIKEAFRRNVAWREVAERLGDRLYGEGAGGPYCQRVLNSTKPTRTVSLSVVGLRNAGAVHAYPPAYSRIFVSALLRGCR